MARNKQARQKEKYYASIDMRHKLREWYKTPAGQALYQQEKQALEEVLPNLFGYNILQLSSHTAHDYLDKSLIRHQIIADYDSQGVDSRINVAINAHQLPIACDSTDVVLMPHTLDVDMNPHLVLREADRILVPEGRVVVLGFNPWSSWGGRHLCNLWHGVPPYSLRFISPARLKDWLVLLGFEIESVSMFFFRPPISRPVFMEKFKFMDKWGEKFWPAFGADYLVVAKKQVSTLTPIKPRWLLRRPTSVSPGFVETCDHSEKNP
ncbi:MAG TPA: methyltransferase domain-containing protein [Gammaproteobacteria bacterium]|nr:methyltransferase domain-containing protein [Gammaproteobacteria bacterium]